MIWQFSYHTPYQPSTHISRFKKGSCQFRAKECAQYRLTTWRTRKKKKGKRKLQGVPQSQTAALPRPQEEEETDKSKQAQTEQTYEKH